MLLGTTESGARWTSHEDSARRVFGVTFSYLCQHQMESFSNAMCEENRVASKVSATLTWLVVEQVAYYSENNTFISSVGSGLNLNYRPVVPTSRTKSLAW
jgi:hypothetical protein